jgi:hypothetical protein
MVTQFDDKGKIFTRVVTKHPVSVWIQTVEHRIKGTVHVKPDHRVIDELNGQERFIAVTDAVVYNNLTNEEMYRSAFLVINSNHIVWLIPEEESVT